jgi:hypothetical protein
MENKEFNNPIDKDKVAENPHLLPYSHTVGGFVIKPIDKGKVKGLSVESMYKQTSKQLDQIREQMELLVKQGMKIQERIRVSEMIYESEIGFKPLIGHYYYLYSKKNGKNVLSLVGNNEWGVNGHPYDKFVAKVELLPDHTWDIIDD